MGLHCGTNRLASIMDTVMVLIILFYAVMLLIIFTQTNCEICRDFYNIGEILVYFLLLSISCTFSWKVRYELVGRQNPTDAAKAKNLNSKKEQWVNTSWYKQLWLLYSIFQLDWSESGIICGFTLTYHVGIFAKMCYHQWGDFHWTPFTYYIVTINYFLAIFALIWPERCIVYYINGMRIYNVRRGTSSDSISTDLLKNTLFHQPKYKYAIAGIFVLLFISQFRTLKPQYTERIKIMYGCDPDSDCGEYWYFFLNELIFHIFKGMIIVNTVINVFLMDEDAYEVSDRKSYAEFNHIITLRTFIFVFFFMYFDMQFIDENTNKDFYNWWNASWIAVLVLIALFLWCCPPNLKELNNWKEVKAFSKRTPRRLLLGIVLWICFTVATAANLIYDHSSLISWKQFGFWLLALSEYSLICTFDPLKRYLKETSSYALSLRPKRSQRSHIDHEKIENSNTFSNNMDPNEESDSKLDSEEQKVKFVEHKEESKQNGNANGLSFIHQRSKSEGHDQTTNLIKRDSQQYDRQQDDEDNNYDQTMSKLFPNQKTNIPNNASPRDQKTLCQYLERSISNVWRLIILVLCLLNVYAICWSIGHTAHGYHSIVNGREADDILYEIAQIFAFAMVQFNSWALFQLIGIMYYVLLTPKERKQNEQRVAHKVAKSYVKANDPFENENIKSSTVNSKDRTLKHQLIDNHSEYGSTGNAKVDK